MTTDRELAERFEQFDTVARLLDEVGETNHSGAYYRAIRHINTEQAELHRATETPYPMGGTQ